MKNATKFWICEKVKDWLIEDATLGAKALRKMLKQHYKIKPHYKRVYMGRMLALKQLYGDWDTSFDNLYSFKAQVESCCLGSVVQIDHHTINDKIRFRRIFVAFKPCIDGFRTGCRPYLAVDSTFLTDRFKGQLVGLKLRGIKDMVRRKGKMASIYALFVRNMGIIGRIVRRVTRMTLLQ